jgi:type IV secretory pathway VirB6-like protein
MAAGKLPKHLRELLAVELAANFTTTLATAVATALTFQVQAGEVWIVDVQATTQCSATGGVKYAVAAPAASTIEGWVYSSGAAITTLVYQRLTAIGTLTATLLHTVATTPGPDVIRFVIVAGATGAVTIQAASGTAGQTTTVFQGSSLSAIRAA